MATAAPIIRIVILAIIVLLAIALIVLVMLQPSNTQGLGAISGGTDTFFAKNKSKTLEGLFRRLTIIFSISLAVLTLIFFILYMPFLYG